MRILDRYILRQIWVPAMLAAIVTSFVVVAGELQRQLRSLFYDVPIAQVSMGDIANISLYALPIFLGYIVPVTFLLGILLSFGRMAQSSEIIAMRAAGISLKRMVLPILLAGVALSALCFWVQDQAQPWAFQRLNQLLSSDLPMRVRLDMLPTGVMHQYGDWRVYIGQRDEAGVLHNIVVMRPEPGGRADTFYANTARLVSQDGKMALELKDGHYIKAADLERAQHITFDLLTETVPSLPERKFERERKGSTLRELWEDEAQIEADYAATNNQVLKQTLLKYRVEFANRFGFPLMCLAVALVAGPIGARAQRSGRSFTFASGLCIIVVYFLIRDLMAPESLKPLWETMLRMQTANLVLMLTGFVLMWRVDPDMNLYDRHLAARFTATYVKILLSLFLLFVLIDFLTVRQELVSRHDVPLSVLAQFYLTLAPTILFEYQTAAIAVLIAALMVIGRAAEQNEITALLTAGVRLWRIVRAPMVIALLITAGTFVFEEMLGAEITLRSEQLQREYFSEFSSKNRPGVSWANLKDGWNCHILKFNKRAMTGEDVFLHRIIEGEVQEIRAGRIYWDPARYAWVLEDGTWARFDTTGDWTQQVNRITLTLAPFLETPEELFALDEPAEAKSARELRQDLVRAASRGVPVMAGWVDFYAKFARPALAFIMILLAIPFAMRVRRGGIAVGFGMSIAIALAYVFVFYVGMGLGHLGKMEPFLAAWLANILFFCGGLVLCYRTPT